ncbi:hypothetical protein BASA62_006786 [Batrachochytrium salamandrivorans]|nr:hypothetical protein BASA62_006786 [Batrachochytrium salamandrivorans]
MTVVDNPGGQKPRSAATVRNLVEKAAATPVTLVEETAEAAEPAEAAKAAEAAELAEPEKPAEAAEAAESAEYLVDHTAWLVEYIESLNCHRHTGHWPQH